MVITFEGIEGAGKSTQCRLLASRLKALGIDPCLTREPGGSELGRILRAELLKTANQGMSKVAELFLYLADRAQHVQEVIRPALLKGQWVLIDRFIDSTLSYQGYGRGLNLDLLYTLNGLATDGLQPDLTFVIDLPVEVGLSRARRRNALQNETLLGRFEAETLEFHERIRQGYLELARLTPERFCVLSGEQGAEALAEAIFNELCARFGNVETY